MRHKIPVRMNGFGRFGLHLLFFYLKRLDKSNFEITHIYDEALEIEEMLSIILTDKKTAISELFDVSILPSSTESGQEVCFKSRIEENVTSIITFVSEDIEKVKVPSDQVWFECSGKKTRKQDYEFIPHSLVIVSATSYSADQTLIVGLNEETFDETSRFVSYGSCTVNAFTPLANQINREYHVTESDVDIIHNTPKYKLAGNGDDMRKSSCTLSIMGPSLLPFLSQNNFRVDYTLVPFTGVSIFKFRFKLAKQARLNDVYHAISEIKNDSGEPIYEIWDNDFGADIASLNQHSAIFVKNYCELKGNNLYLSGYFDNENSVTRFFDVAKFIVERIKQ